MKLKGRVAVAIFQRAKRCTVVLLLFIYVLGSHIELFHSLVHKQEASLFDTKQFDTGSYHAVCNQHMSGGGSIHLAHVVKEDTCSLCHAQLYHFHIANERVPAPAINFLGPFAFYSFVLHIEGIDFQSAGRAPPVS